MSKPNEVLFEVAPTRISETVLVGMKINEIHLDFHIVLLQKGMTCTPSLWSVFFPR